MTALEYAQHELHSWQIALTQPASWAQLTVLLVAAIGVWAVHHYLGRYLGEGPVADEITGVRRFTRRTAQRVLFPFTMALGVLIGRAILVSFGVKVVLLNIAVSLLLSLAIIRFLVYVLRRGFPATPLLKTWENLISTVVWGVVALHLLGWLQPVLRAMDDLAIHIGSTRISLLSSLKLLLLFGLLTTLAYWLSGFIERQVRQSTHITPAMQVALAKFTKFFLVALAFLIALNAVGIDLTALTVFGGALGVGIGFGLQRIASNFISGFILVLDRSIRPGDVITIGNSFGWVRELRARYIVVRNRDGVETLIPNENLVTSEVINWSYSDRNVRIRIPVQVSYADDPEQALALMLEAGRTMPRVLSQPAPVARLMEFGDNGINLELRVWIQDPEEGISNVRSDLNLAIWRAFKQAQITIPFPQRDIYVKSVPPQWGPPPAD